MGLSVKWDITYSCNLNCDHCLNGDLLKMYGGDDLSTGDAKKVINNLQSVDIDYMHILGGEPTFRKDFYEIIDYLNRNKIKYGFNTNGLKMGNKKFLESMSNEFLSNIVISLEGPTSDLNDHIRGINVFDKVVSNLKKLIQYKRDHDLNHFTLTVSMVVSQSNYMYVNEMIDFCLRLGIDELNLLDFIIQGNAKNDSTQLLNFEDELNVVKQIAKRYSSVKNRLRINPKFVRPVAKEYCEKVLGLEFPIPEHGCGAGSKFAFINNAGKIFPCDRYVSFVLEKVSESRLDLTKDAFLKIWSDDIFNHPFELTEGSIFYQNYEPCNKCKYLQMTCYPCPVGNFKNHKIVYDKCQNYFDLIAMEGEKIG